MNLKHKEQQYSIDDYDFSYADMATGVVYHRDENGLYRKYYDEAAKRERKVYFDGKFGTGLEKGSKCYTTGITDDRKCKRLIECIANDEDISSLGMCMDVLRDKDMFKVAIQDVNEVSPHMIKIFMKKFSI